MTRFFDFYTKTCPCQTHSAVKTVCHWLIFVSNSQKRVIFKNHLQLRGLKNKKMQDPKMTHYWDAPAHWRDFDVQNDF
jgi:hypothetical protein